METTNYYNYKCRAETYCDIEILIRMIFPAIAKFKVVRINENMPDIELTFKSNLPIDSIKKIMREIPDNHVMIDTLNLKHLYTGLR